MRNFSPGCVKTLSHVIISVIVVQARARYTRTKYLNAMMPKESLCTQSKAILQRVYDLTSITYSNRVAVEYAEEDIRSYW